VKCDAMMERKHDRRAALIARRLGHSLAAAPKNGITPAKDEVLGEWSATRNLSSDHAARSWFVA
jgi:hypothetical protein